MLRDKFQGVVVFSTYVEVILNHSLLNRSPMGILHVCGGDPIMKILLKF